MHGNVWEWCHDQASLSYYKTSPTDDPPGAADVGQDHHHACRGGSFLRHAREIRSAKRAFWAPEKCFFDIGFRVAAEIREPGLPSAIPPAEQGQHALLFDGKNASVQTPVKLDVRKPFTVEAIITLPVIPDEPTFVISDLQTGGLGFGPTPEGKLQSSLNAGKNGRGDHDGYKSVESRDDILTNTPIHVAATFDGQILTLFVNGKMQREQRHFDTTFNSPLTVMLGGNPNDNGLPSPSGMFSGAMREIRISNTVRYDAHFTPSTRHETDEHTLALYHCDKSKGDQLTDHSGNNNHGQIVGAKWVTYNGSAIDNDSEVDASP
jgi:hypothetical protein